MKKSSNGDYGYPDVYKNLIPNDNNTFQYSGQFYINPKDKFIKFKYKIKKNRNSGKIIEGEEIYNYNDIENVDEIIGIFDKCLNFIKENYTVQAALPPLTVINIGKENAMKKYGHVYPDNNKNPFANSKSNKDYYLLNDKNYEIIFYYDFDNENDSSNGTIGIIDKNKNTELGIEDLIYIYKFDPLIDRIYYIVEDENVFMEPNYEKKKFINMDFDGVKTTGLAALLKILDWPAYVKYHIMFTNDYVIDDVNTMSRFNKLKKTISNNIFLKKKVTNNEDTTDNSNKSMGGKRKKSSKRHKKPPKTSKKAVGGKRRSTKRKHHKK